VTATVADSRPGVVFWLISAALLFWGVMGSSIYAAYFIETPAEFASTAESAANSASYAAYVANIPMWAIAVGMIAAGARLLGAVGLFMRRAWALPFYVASLIFFLATLFRGFVLANAASVMNAGHIGVELVFAGLSLFAIWFAYDARARGILR